MRARGQSGKESVPAYAGVIPLDDKYLFHVFECSRVCGGDPKVVLPDDQRKIVFPRMRG